MVSVTPPPDTPGPMRSFIHHDAAIPAGISTANAHTPHEVQSAKASAKVSTASIRTARPAVATPTRAPRTTAAMRKEVVPRFVRLERARSNALDTNPRYLWATA